MSIRRTYESVLYFWVGKSAEEHELLRGLLRGHLQLLVPDLASVEDRLPEQEQGLAAYVRSETQRILARPDTSPRHVEDMAIQSRALLALYRMATRPAKE